MAPVSALAEEALLDARVNSIRRARAGPCAAEIGIVVGLSIGGGGGSNAGRRELVLELVQTPLQDEFFAASAGKAPAGSKKKGAASAASGAGAVAVSLDCEWIAEHASQVDRMLPGGVVVLGLYVYLPDATFRASSTASQLVSAQRALAKRVQGIPGRDHALLIHIDASSRRTAAKTCGLGSGASLSHCELKFSKIASNLIRVRSSYDLGLGGHRIVAGGAKSLRRELSKFAERERSRLAAMVVHPRGSDALIGASTTDMQVVDVLPNPKASEIVCDILSAVATRGPATEDGSKVAKAPDGVRGRWAGAGTLALVGCAYAREPASAIAECLRMDVVRSLQARVDAYVDEAMAYAEEDEAAEDSDGEGDGEGPSHPLLAAEGDGAQGLRTPLAIPLPSRTLLLKDAVDGNSLGHYRLLYSDYKAQEDERGAQASVETAEELLSFTGFEPEASQEASHTEGGEVSEDEDTAFWDPTGSAGAGAGMGARAGATAAKGQGGNARKQQQQAPNFGLLAGLAALFLAVLFGLLKISG